MFVSYDVSDSSSSSSSSLVLCGKTTICIPADYFIVWSLMNETTILLFYFFLEKIDKCYLFSFLKFFFLIL